MKGTIKAHKHFKFVMNKGKKQVFSHCIVYSLPISVFTNIFKSYIGKDFVYGIMTTKKLGNAPMRNLAKRRLRVFVCEQNLQNLAVVVVAREPILRESFSQNIS